MGLDYWYAKLVLAVPEKLGVNSVDRLPRGIRVATRYYNITSSYLRSKGLDARIVKVSGATEVMPHLGAADAVVDVMSTGTTLRLPGRRSYGGLGVLIASSRGLGALLQMGQASRNHDEWGASGQG